MHGGRIRALAGEMHPVMTDDTRPGVQMCGRADRVSAEF